MAKITTTIVDGWPMMSPLGRREASLVAAELAADEAARGQVIGTNGQTVVATDRRVLVVRAGVAAGQIFGGAITSYPYSTIRGVEVRMQLAQGDFELLVRPGAEPEPERSWMNAALMDEHPPVRFGKLDAPAFTSMAAKITERLPGDPARPSVDPGRQPQ